MITEVILPKMGQTMEKGTIVEWLKREGDPVQQGEVLFTAETDKAVLEVEAGAQGFLRKILILEGVEVPVMTVVALVTREAEEDIGAHQSTPRQMAREEAAGWQPETRSPETLHAAAGRIFASPKARKVARETGVDLTLVTGTGPGGRIVGRDLLKAEAWAPKATPVARRTAEARGIDLAAYEHVRDAGVLTAELFARLYRVAEERITLVFHERALALKVSLPRPKVQCAPDDTDCYAGQQYAPLLDLEL